MSDYIHGFTVELPLDHAEEAIIMLRPMRGIHAVRFHAPTEQVQVCFDAPVRDEWFTDHWLPILQAALGRWSPDFHPLVDEPGLATPDAVQREIDGLLRTMQAEVDQDQPDPLHWALRRRDLGAARRQWLRAWDPKNYSLIFDPLP